MLFGYPSIQDTLSSRVLGLALEQRYLAYNGYPISNTSNAKIGPQFAVLFHA